MDRSYYINTIMSKISLTSKKIRDIEDDCHKFSVAPSANGVYIALVGYREALQELLVELRGADDQRKSRNG